MNTSTPVSPTPVPPVARPQPVPPPPRAWTAGRITAVVLGAMLLLGSLGIGIFGATLAVADNALRDDGGFLMSGEDTFSTASYAMLTENVEVHADGGAELLPQQIIGAAKVTASPNGDAPVFVGVAATSDVEEYLDGVSRETFAGFHHNVPVYTTTTGGAPDVAPTASDIWVREASGTGTQSVVWPVENGDWTVVVMNADGSRGVSADLAAGATVPALGWVVAVTMLVAVVTFVVASVLLFVGLRR